MKTLSATIAKISSSTNTATKRTMCVLMSVISFLCLLLMKKWVCGGVEASSSALSRPAKAEVHPSFIADKRKHCSIHVRAGKEQTKAKKMESVSVHVTIKGPILAIQLQGVKKKKRRYITMRRENTKSLQVQAANNIKSSFPQVRTSPSRANAGTFENKRKYCQKCCKAASINYFHN